MFSSEFLGDSNNKKPTYDPLAHLPREIREPQPLNVIMRNLECLLLDLPLDDCKSANQTNDNKSSATSNSEQKESVVVDKKEGEKDAEKKESVGESVDDDVENKWMQEPAINVKTSRMGKLNRIACMSNSLSSYLISTDSKRNGQHIRDVTAKIYDDVNIWLSRLFRYS